MIESVKNLRDVIILTVFALSVFALLGLQIYMGVLTQKCIKNFTLANEKDNGSWGEGHQAWVQFNNNHTNWYRRAEMKNYQLCGNSSGAGPCPEDYVCLEVSLISPTEFQLFKIWNIFIPSPFSNFLEPSQCSIYSAGVR